MTSLGSHAGFDSRTDFASPDAFLDLVRGHIDTAYYLSKNHDVRRAGIDPVEHFMQAGWREGRSPGPGFDVRYYLRQNPDVAAAGINPLVHYLTVGAREGRRPRPPLAALRRKLERLQAPEDRTAKPIDPVDRPLCLEALVGDLRATANGAGLILSFSHDDYADAIGGVQNVIADEERAFTRMRWTYLHVSPNVRLPTLAKPAPPKDFYVRLRLNGNPLGVCSFADLTAAAATASREAGEVHCVVHHFMGHSPEAIGGLLEACGIGAPIVWTHDLFTLCPSYALMRNDVAFCGGPPPASASCAICCYGVERARHVERMRSFFERSKPTILAPSETILAFWRRQGGLACNEAAVVPLARLAPVQRETSVPDILRVAHLGSRTIAKGWPAFEDLALRMAGDPRYSFFQLGIADGPPLPSVVRNIPVHVGPGHRSAMSDAVSEGRIDVVVNWSFAFETFSFTTLEALAGGAYVIARRGAGNVWSAVAANAPGQGCAVAHEDSLLDLFAGNGLMESVLTARRRCGVIHYGGGTADWLAARLARLAPAGAERELG